MAATRKFRVPMTEQNTTSQKDDGYDKLPARKINQPLYDNILQRLALSKYFSLRKPSAINFLLSLPFHPLFHIRFISLIHTVAGVFAETFTYTYCTTAI